MSLPADEELLSIVLTHGIKKEIRLQAWKYILGLTGSEEGLQRLKSNKKYGPFLSIYLNEPQAEKEVLDLAHKCVISLTSTAEGSTFLLTNRCNLVGSLLQDISAASDFVMEKCYILSNISQHCNVLGQASSSLQEVWRTGLRDKFCSSKRVEREKYEFLSFVFANIATTTEGRKLFIEDESFLRSFFSGLDPEELDTRRLGTALTIRNCCIETSYLKKLLKDYDILPVLLLPLMGSDEYEDEIMNKLPLQCQYLGEDKKREKLPQVRKALVQALSLLCYTEEAWKCLQDTGVYYVIRELHLNESDPDVIEAIETMVGFLLVENYADSESLQQAVLPAETDVMKDIPEVVLG